MEDVRNLAREDSAADAAGAPPTISGSADVEAVTNEKSEWSPGDKLPLSVRISRMSWGWFPSVVSTGALSSLISQQPYTFRGLETIGKIIYILNIVMFIFFTFLVACRFIMKPRAFPASLHHPSESFFFGSWWVSLALILYSMAGYGIPGLAPDNEWLIHAMRVLFWMYFACAMIVAVFQYHIIFFAERLDVSDAMPAWIFPSYPFVVSGPLAAQIAKTQPADSATQMIIAGISGQGLGWMISLLMYGIYFQRLLRSDLPDPGVRPGMFVSVGPAAYTCTGLLALGKQAVEKIPEGFIGITAVDVGSVWLAIALPASLFLWMTAIWFSGVSVVTILREAKHMRFTLVWWASVFPNCGLTIATIQIGQILKAPPLLAVASALTIIIAIFWLACVVLHIRAVWKQDVLAPGRDPGVDAVNMRHDDPARYKEHMH